jgi:hypothetical protein
MKVEEASSGRVRNFRVRGALRLLYRGGWLAGHVITGEVLARLDGPKGCAERPSVERQVEAEKFLEGQRDEDKAGRYLEDAGH